MLLYYFELKSNSLILHSTNGRSTGAEILVVKMLIVTANVFNDEKSNTSGVYEASFEVNNVFFTGE